MNALNLHVVYTLELTIGFINSSYQAIEGDPFAAVEFGILGGGMPAIDITVELLFSDLTATSKCSPNKKKFCHF